MRGCLPFVSVILPTFNRPNYAITAFKSLLSQHYPADFYEIIVVDNGISDETINAFRSYCQKSPLPVNLKYVREQRPGLVFARHTGAYHAQGSYLIFGDDDARYEHNWISEIIQTYQMFSDAGAVGTRILIEWDSPPPSWVLPYERVLGRLVYGDQLVSKLGLQINGGSFSIKKELLSYLGGFNPGQVGDYILGDSETGLCDKLQVANVPIAWTPRTTMWHRQVVSRHATLKDIKRRFWNNGICFAYRHIYCDCKSSWRKCAKILRFLLGQFKNLVCRALIFRDNTDDYLLILDFEFFKAYLLHLYKYLFDSEIKSKVNSKDWAFTSEYIAPPVDFIVQAEPQCLSRSQNNFQ